MSSILTPQALAFCSDYSEQRWAFEQATEGACTFVEHTLRDAGLPLHAVTARTKEHHSLLKKLRRKHYADPASEITDLVGVRVIARYRGEVDQSEEVLRGRLSVDDGRSIDKSSQLDRREFGYRSVHLIVSLADLGVDVPEITHGYMFEIQIRSILEHAWAENEHDLIYKSGLVVSRENIRAFAAAAGTLELLDREFERLRSVANEEAQMRQEQIENGLGIADSLDAVGVIAILRVLAPHNPGFLGSDTPLGSDASLINEALHAAGLSTVNAVRLAFGSERFKAATERFAALSGVTVHEVSHMAIGALLATTQDGFPLDQFPDLLFDPNLIAAIEGDDD